MAFLYCLHVGVFRDGVFVIIRKNNQVMAIVVGAFFAFGLRGMADAPTSGVTSQKEIPYFLATMAAMVPHEVYAYSRLHDSSRKKGCVQGDSCADGEPAAYSVDRPFRMARRSFARAGMEIAGRCEPVAAWDLFLEVEKDAYLVSDAVATLEVLSQNAPAAARLRAESDAGKPYASSLLARMGALCPEMLAMVRMHNKEENEQHKKSCDEMLAQGYHVFIACHGGLIHTDEPCIRFCAQKFGYTTQLAEYDRDKVGNREPFGCSTDGKGHYVAERWKASCDLYEQDARVDVTAMRQSEAHRFWYDRCKDASRFDSRTQFLAACRKYMYGNYKNAYKGFVSSAGHGHPWALYMQGLMLKEGKGIKRDLDAAIGVLRNAQEAGYARALMPIADIWTERSVWPLALGALQTAVEQKVEGAQLLVDRVQS